MILPDIASLILIYFDITRHEDAIAQYIVT